MLSSILKQEYGRNRGQDLRKFYEHPVVCGCLFQSFDDFEKNIVLRFITNEGKFYEKQFLKELNQNDPSVQMEFKNVLLKLQELCLIQYSKIESCYKMFKGFIANLQKYLLNPVKSSGSELPPDYKNQMEQFDLLRLLYEGNVILNQCKLTTINWKYLDDTLSKENFDYIRAPVYEKIGILIKGYLRYNKNKTSLSDILILSLFDPNKAYKISQKNTTVVRELESLKLLKIISNQSQFVISEYLHHFAFHSKRSGVQKKGSLKCKMIIETNFKVYTQVQSQNRDNYHMIKSILKSLIQIEHEEYNFQELIVGSITKEKVTNLFKKGITSSQFFDFFQQYMEKSQKIEEKDLGKWNKIKFLGLEGINAESPIPNNVKQQIKLWENNQKYRELYGGNELGSDSDIGQDEERIYKESNQARRR